MTKGISIAQIRAATAAEWDELWTACPYAAYSQSRAWSEDWEAYTRGSLRPRPMLLRFNDGHRVLLPLTRERRRSRLTARHLMSPAGTYGGWLTGQALMPHHAEVLTEWLLAEHPRLWWRINPFDPLAAVPMTRATEPDETHVVRLEHGVEDRVDHHGHREAVHKARRAGLVVRRAAGPRDWETYYSIYAAALKRWGSAASSAYGARLFEILRRRGAPGIDLWLVEADDGTTVGGAVNLCGPRHVAGWHMATRPEYVRMGAAKLLVQEMIEDAAERAFSWFDLHPSGGHAGVTRFKENCGGRPLACPVIVSGRPARSRRRVVADVVRRLSGSADESLPAPDQKP